jgi:hypothetical protein
MESDVSILNLSDEVLVTVCSYLSQSSDLLRLSKGKISSSIIFLKV